MSPNSVYACVKFLWCVGLAYWDLEKNIPDNCTRWLKIWAVNILDTDIYIHISIGSVAENCLSLNPGSTTYQLHDFKQGTNLVLTQFPYLKVGIMKYHIELSRGLNKGDNEKWK